MLPNWEELVLEHIELPAKIANKMKSRLPARFEYDDLVGEGNLALVKAARKFDPERGVKFVTYAWSVIRGGILNYIRINDWVPVKLGCQMRRAGKVIPMMMPMSDAMTGRRAPAEAAAPRSPQRQETNEELWFLMSKTNNRDQYIIWEYDGKETPMAQIAERLDIGKSWVAQARETALRKIREKLARSGELVLCYTCKLEPVGRHRSSGQCFWCRHGYKRKRGKGD